MSVTAEPPAFSFVLVKLASRCNINCTYCYWFRDPEVYSKPPVLTLQAEDQFCARLEQHIHTFGLKRFLLVFHGGEPLLFPKYRFVDLQEKVRGVEHRSDCCIERGLTTNAILVDDEWAGLLKTHDVSVTVSVDGPPDINDRQRVDFKGRGTLAATLVLPADQGGDGPAGCRVPQDDGLALRAQRHAGHGSRVGVPQAVGDRGAHAAQERQSILLHQAGARVGLRQGRAGPGDDVAAGIHQQRLGGTRALVDG